MGDINFRNKSRTAFKTRLARAGLPVTSPSAATIRSSCPAGLVPSKAGRSIVSDVEEAIAMPEANTVS